MKKLLMLKIIILGFFVAYSYAFPNKVFPDKEITFQSIKNNEEYNNELYYNYDVIYNNTSYNLTVNKNFNIFLDESKRHLNIESDKFKSQIIGVPSKITNLDSKIRYLANYIDISYNVKNDDMLFDIINKDKNLFNIYVNDSFCKNSYDHSIIGMFDEKENTFIYIACFEERYYIDDYLNIIEYIRG